MKKIGTIEYNAPPENIVSALTDIDVLLPGIPFVVGLSGSRLRLLFRRFLFTFKDEYEIKLEESNGKEARLFFHGEKSNIQILYKIYPQNIQIFADYKGPRKWVVWPKISELSLEIIRYVIKHSNQIKAKVKENEKDYSSKLADLSWITKLLMKSMLVKTMDIAIHKGEFNNFIENLHNLGVFKNYKVIYVSGSGNGSFRLLFHGGELVGVYAIVKGEEIVGDATRLNELEGYYKIKIYGSLVSILEVLK